MSKEAKEITKTLADVVDRLSTMEGCLKEQQSQLQGLKNNAADENAEESDGLKKKRKRVALSDLDANSNPLLSVLTELTKKREEPKPTFERKVSEMNNGTFYPDTLTRMSWSDARLIMDPCAMVVFLYREADNDDLDPLRFIYPRSSTYGPILNEVTTIWRARGISADDIERLTGCLKGWVITLGLFDINKAGFSGVEEEDPVVADELYGHTYFTALERSLREAQAILHPYVRRTFAEQRGPQAAKAYDNFTAIQPCDVPFSSGPLLNQLATRQLMANSGNGQPPKKLGIRTCNFCHEEITVSYQDHNAVCPKRKKH